MVRRSRRSGTDWSETKDPRRDRREVPRSRRHVGPRGRRWRRAGIERWIKEGGRVARHEREPGRRRRQTEEVARLARRVALALSCLQGHRLPPCRPISFLARVHVDEVFIKYTMTHTRPGSTRNQEEGAGPSAAVACWSSTGFSTRTPLALGSLFSKVVESVGAAVGVALPLAAVLNELDDADPLSCHAGSPGGLIANGSDGDETEVDRVPPFPVGFEMDEEEDC